MKLKWNWPIWGFFSYLSRTSHVNSQAWNDPALIIQHVSLCIWICIWTDRKSFESQHFSVCWSACCLFTVHAALGNLPLQRQFKQSLSTCQTINIIWQTTGPKSLEIIACLTNCLQCRTWCTQRTTSQCFSSSAVGYFWLKCQLSGDSPIGALLQNKNRNKVNVAWNHHQIS